MTRRRVLTGVAVCVLAASGTPFVIAAPAQAHAPAAASVRVVVDGVSPASPPPSQHLRRLSFALTLTNDTATSLEGVTVQAIRALPIETPTELGDALAHPTPPTDGPRITARTPISVDLPAGGSVDVTFTTSTGIPDITGTLCQCDKNGAVYPVWFTASSPHVNGGRPLGRARTYVPLFYRRPAPRQVSWVLPLIDTPHRLVGDTVFTDDQLAASVGSGRLARMLQVIDRVGRDGIPVTVIADPELLDELQVMAKGKYTVTTGNGGSYTGHGSAAAAAWLTELQAVLQQDPNVSVALTPYADPDVDALTHARLPWSVTLPAAMQTRVTTALGLTSLPPTSLAWPPSGRIDRRTLHAMIDSGVTSLLLDSRAVQRTTDGRGLPLTLARLGVGDTSVVTALESATDRRLIGSAFEGRDGGGGLARAELLAEIAARATASRRDADAVVLAPPRRIDPLDVQGAVTTIEQTSSSTFSNAVALSAIIDPAVDPSSGRNPRSALNAPVAGAARLSTEPDFGPHMPLVLLRRIHKCIARLKVLSDLLVHTPAATAMMTSTSQGIQRLESSAWRTDAAAGGPATGRARASQLLGQIRGQLQMVYIVKSSAGTGSYTLASDNSPLPVTVENDGAFAARVRVAVKTVGAHAGLKAENLGTQQIAPHTKTTLHVPTQVDRSGRIQVNAQLTTADGKHIGRPLTLYVRSTVLGTIGVVITITAGAVLALALLVRLVRTVLARRRNPPRPRRSPVRDVNRTAARDRQARSGAVAVHDDTPTPETVPPSEPAS